MQHRSRTLEHRAAQRAQKAAELKIKADRYMEQSKVEEQEAQSYLKRADRLQLATEAEFAARRTSPEANASSETPTGRACNSSSRSACPVRARMSFSRSPAR